MNLLTKIKSELFGSRVLSSGWLLVILVSTIFWSGPVNYWQAWLGLAVAVSCFIAWNLTLIDWSIALVVGFGLIRTLVAVNYTGSWMWNLPEQAHIVLANSAYEFLVYALIIIYAVKHMPRIWLLREGFPKLFTAAYVWTLITLFMWHEPRGFLWNHGMNASMLVVLSFFSFPGALYITLPIVLLAKAATPIAVFATACLWRVCTSRNWKKPLMFFVGGLVAATTHLASHPEKLLTGDNRFARWSWYWDFFKRLPIHQQIFGLGGGSFRPLGPLIQNWHEPPSMYLLWMHNDWGQVVFEFGWVGFALLSILLFRAFNHARIALPRMAGALLCLLVWGVTDYPFHLAASAFFSCVIVVLCFDTESVYYDAGD